MIISIKDGLAEVEYKRGKRTIKKLVLLDSLIQAMASKNETRTPLLPVGIRQYIKTEDGHRLFIELPAMKRGIKYINRDGKVIFEGVVPFPWGVICLDLMEESSGTFTITDSYIYGLKRPLMSENDELYYWPAANVFSDCRICWGGTFKDRESKIKSLLEAGKVIDYYFSSDFNTDLHPRINIYSRYEDMLRNLKDLPAFNNDILVSTGKTLRNLY